MVEGEVQRLAIELADGGGIEVTVIVPDDLEDAIRVRAEDLADVPTGSEVAVEVATVTVASQELLEADGGVEAVDVEVLEAAEGVAPDAGLEDAGLEDAGLSAIPGGARPVAAVVATVGTQGSDGVTVAALASEITNSVAPYWSESTGGRLTFQVTSQTSAGSYGSWGTTSTCGTSQILGLLSWSAERGGVSPTYGQQRHSVLYTPRLASCSFAGVAHVGDGGSVWINGTSGTRWAVIAHELGHTLTLGHSDTRVNCAGADGSSAECATGEYGDAYDAMGVSTGGTGLISGAHLDKLGLLPPDSLVQADSSTAVALSPVGGLAGVRFLKFVSGGVSYYAEYRAAVGRDADLATTRKGCPYGAASCSTLQRYTPGVVIRRVESSASGEPTFLLNAGASNPWFVLPVGRSFTTADGMATLKVVSTTGGQAQLDLQFLEAAIGPFVQVVLSPDMTGDRRADVFTVNASGQLHLHPGLGNGRLGPPILMGSGWDGLRVFAPGDWNGDRRNDLVAADKVSGRLWLFAGNGAGGLGAPIQIGRGWTEYRIIPAGDVNGDGPVDLLAIDKYGVLWLYPGTGNGGFGRRIQVGRGWGTFELYAAGDMNRDGRIDILGINSNGLLFFYAGRGGGYFRPAVQVGRGWTGFVFASGADLNSDGVNDLLGRHASGSLWFYAGRTSGRFATAVKIATDW